MNAEHIQTIVLLMLPVLTHGQVTVVNVTPDTQETALLAAGRFHVRYSLRNNKILTMFIYR